MSNALAEAAHSAATGAPVPRPDNKPVAIQRLEGVKSAIQLAIPATSRLDGERFVRVMSTEIQKNPKLNECTRESLLGSFLECASLGLEPGPLGLASIVPFNNRKKVGNEWVTEVEAQLIIEYRGFIELGYRSGLLKDVDLDIVHEGDVWRYYKDESGKHLYHEPKCQDTAVIAYYGIFQLTTGGSVIQVLEPGEVEAFRKRSSSQRKFNPETRRSEVSDEPLGAWASDYDAMALKTVVRRAENKLPKSTEMHRAFAADEHVVVNHGVEATARPDDNVIETEGWETDDPSAPPETAPGAAAPSATATAGPDDRKINSEEMNALLQSLRDAEIPPSEHNAFVSAAIGRTVRGVTSLKLSEARLVVEAIADRVLPAGDEAADPEVVNEPDPSDPDSPASIEDIAKLSAFVADHVGDASLVEAYINEVLGAHDALTNSDLVAVRDTVVAEKAQENAASPGEPAPFDS